MSRNGHATVWDAGIPALSVIPVRNRRFPWVGWVPSRRKILRGFHDPETGRDEEGQVSRVLREFHDQGVEPSLDELARRLAIDPGDVDLIAVLFGGDVSAVPIERRERLSFAGLSGGPSR